MEYKTDSLLVHLARAGDEDACEKLVKKYYSSIYQYCLLHINDPYEAEDLTQEVFTRFFATVYKGNIIKNLIMDCQSYTKYRPNETTGGIFVSWRRKEELPTGA